MIVALQYYGGDLERTVELAGLLADVEPVPRSDVLLAFVCQPDTPSSSIMDDAVSYCSKKFPVDKICSKRGDHGHPRACTALWTGTMEFFHEYYPGEAAATLDGGDGVPLHLDWLSLLMAEHARTISAGKLVTGSPYYFGGCPLHVNPNAVFQLSVWDVEPSLRTTPAYDGTLLTHFDVYHRRAMLTNASLSSVVHTDWRGGGNVLSGDLLRSRAARSLWLHGYKDDDLCAVARWYFDGGNTVRPEFQRYDLDYLYLQEALSRRRRA
jgi:hypothetical protein